MDAFTITLVVATPPCKDPNEIYNTYPLQQAKLFIRIQQYCSVGCRHEYEQIICPSA